MNLPEAQRARTEVRAVPRRRGSVTDRKRDMLEADTATNSPGQGRDSLVSGRRPQAVAGLRIVVVANELDGMATVNAVQQINCVCGYIVRGADDDELWQNAQDHVRADHPDLVGKVTREDILAQAEEVS